MCWIAATQKKRFGPFLKTDLDGIWKLGGDPQRYFLLVRTQSDTRASAGPPVALSVPTLIDALALIQAAVITELNRFRKGCGESVEDTQAC